MTIYCAFFTALIIVGGFISIPIPISPVPIVLADFFIMLTGLFLGLKHGLISTSLYIALGTIGLPVFAGGRGGLIVFFGPTGGFLFGYLAMVVFIGFISDKMKPKISSFLIALIGGNILLYLIGVPWLRIVTNISWSAAIATGFIPFAPGAIFKIIAAIAIGHTYFIKLKRAPISSSHRGDDVVS